MPVSTVQLCPSAPVPICPSAPVPTAGPAGASGSGSVVERLLAKEKVAGSNPVFRSMLPQAARLFGEWANRASAPAAATPPPPRRRSSAGRRYHPFPAARSASFDSTLPWRIVPEWRNGRRGGLKIRWGITPCQFDSDLRHHPDLGCHPDLRRHADLWCRPDLMFPVPRRPGCRPGLAPAFRGRATDVRPLALGHFPRAAVGRIVASASPVNPPRRDSQANGAVPCMKRRWQVVCGCGAWPRTGTGPSPQP